MVKIKLLNRNKGRNEPTFRIFALTQNLFREIGVEFTDGDDFDFIFIGMQDFIFKKLSLEESIDKGLTNIEEYGDKAFLFDGSDSTSLLGAYEVLKDSKARYLFKNQLLKTRSDYKQKTPFNKIFFKGNSDLLKGYDISENDWNRIKLSGFNLGNILPFFAQFQPTSLNKKHDICAIYQGEHVPNQDHLTDNHTFYTQHRTTAWEVLKKLTKYSSYRDKLPKEQFLRLMADSKVALSPFGMGEICFRDFELMQFGTLMIKPSMEHLQTIPNPFLPGETYLPVKHDWSNLEEVLEDAVENYYEYQELVENFREKYKSEYNPVNFVKYWYNILSKQPELR